MTQTVVKTEDFVKWILDQDDSRPVRMGEERGADECGCVMVQYARNILKIKDEDIDCTLLTFDCRYRNFVLDTVLGNIVVGYWSTIKTFGDVKKGLASEYKS